MRKIIKNRKNIIYLLDMLIIFFSGITLCLLSPYDNKNDILQKSLYIPNIIALLMCISIFQYLLHTYDNIWRYAGSFEYVRLIFGVLLGSLLYILINNLLLVTKTSYIFTVMIFSCSIFFMLLMRFLYRIYRIKFILITGDKIQIAIIGAGNTGVKLMEEIKYNPESVYEVKCFIDDDVDKIGKKIRGIPVVGPISQFNELIKNTLINEVIIAIPTITESRKIELLKIISKSCNNVKILPDILDILQNKYKILDCDSDFNVDDLLERDEVTFDKKEINHFFCNKVIMVTGGGGSIGSELCRQIAQSKPALLVIVDYYENNAYDIQQELLYEYKDNLNLAVEIATIQDKEKIDQLFQKYLPQIVFHAAAHKHVPFMEECPEEAIKNNIFGTYHLVQAANRWNVEKFVLISTDKAVNPTSIMGASKRMCEMIIQSMKNRSNTEFVAVRFGNVLGSNGSVIPLFKKQIEHGGPITITDKRVFRYFMTITEAAQLVLRVGSMESHSEIYVLDMGTSVNILELAERLTLMLGHIPYTEIPIEEIGMRPGEKLNEELFMHEELVKTQNQKIFIENEKPMTVEEIEEKLNILTTALETKNKDIIRQSIIEVVPSFKINANEDQVD